ncbi:MAG TPA: glycosyl transferase, partial [Iamia sp.]
GMTTGMAPAMAAGPGGGAGGGAGGLLDSGTVSDEVVAALRTDADAYDWVAATVGANRAAGYQLATEESVMPLGGFNGSDPSPTLAQFQTWVAEGRIHFFVAGGSFGAGQGQEGTSTATEITAWVEATFPATTVDGTTLYDLTDQG